MYQGCQVSIIQVLLVRPKGNSFLQTGGQTKGRNWWSLFPLPKKPFLLSLAEGLNGHPWWLLVYPSTHWSPASLSVTNTCETFQSILASRLSSPSPSLHFCRSWASLSTAFHSAILVLLSLCLPLFHPLCSPLPSPDLLLASISHSSPPPYQA